MAPFSNFLFFRVYEIYVWSWVEDSANDGPFEQHCMQYDAVRTRHCTTIEDSAMSIGTVLFYSTADCCNTVQVRYGKVELGT